MKNKSFDCVEFQDRAGERIYEQLKGMSIQEQLEFWRKQTEILRELQQAAPRMATQPSTRLRSNSRAHATSKSRQ